MKVFRLPGHTLQLVSLLNSILLQKQLLPMCCNGGEIDLDGLKQNVDLSHFGNVYEDSTVHYQVSLAYYVYQWSNKMYIIKQCIRCNIKQDMTVPFARARAKLGGRIR